MRTLSAAIAAIAMLGMLSVLTPTPTLAAASENPVATVSVDVTRHRVSGDFNKAGANATPGKGSYKVRLKSINVTYGSGQPVTPCVLVHINEATKYAYVALSGEGDEQTVNITDNNTVISAFFAPGEPTKDDSGKAVVEVVKKGNDSVVATLEADVTKNRLSGDFAKCGANTTLQRGNYRARLKEISVKYGSEQRVTPCVLLRLNELTKYAYMVLNGETDEKSFEVAQKESTLSCYFAPGEPTNDDSGTATVELFGGPTAGGARTPAGGADTVTLEADVIKNRVAGSFPDNAINVTLGKGKYKLRLKSINVTLGKGQPVTPCVFAHINEASKYGYVCLQGEGDEENITVEVNDSTLSVFFVPSEPCKDDSGKAIVEVLQKTTVLHTLEVDVTKSRLSGDLAKCGANTPLTPGTYTVKLKRIDVKYGTEQRVTPCVLLRANIFTKDAYFTLNGEGDEKTIEITDSGVTLSAFFAPGEPTKDDSGSATIEVSRN